MEFDAIEAPSQVLEEWAWDYETLRRFARDETGQPIPRSLVDRLNASRMLYAAYVDMYDLGSAAIALDYYSRDLTDVDLTAAYLQRLEPVHGPGTASRHSSPSRIPAFGRRMLVLQLHLVESLGRRPAHALPEGRATQPRYGRRLSRNDPCTWRLGVDERARATILRSRLVGRRVRRADQVHHSELSDGGYAVSRTIAAMSQGATLGRASCKHSHLRA